MDGALNDLIGGLALDAALRDRGRSEREADEGTPWEALRWQRRWDPRLDDGTLRWRVSTALEVLDTLAHVADEGFEATHGGAQRRRGVSTPARWGDGLSEQLKPSPPRRYMSAFGVCLGKSEQELRGRPRKCVSTWRSSAHS